MTGIRLFDDNENLSTGDHSRPAQGTRSDELQRTERVRRSALWSAYGDALGWISELTNETGLRKRTAGAPLHRPIEWKRRIGGRAGVTVTLPQGCYSDDSQLRLATSRSIRSDGFDVEAFSKVELPVWLSYALGGGKATSTAARNLARSRVQWFANTFRGWTDSGGNGAAMRIQPHVWAACDPDNPATFLPDVVRNAICTHSHPNGLMGAVLHALALAHALVTGHHPSPNDLIEATKIAANLSDVFQDDVEVGQYWRTAFERDAGAFSDAWTQVVDDSRAAIEEAAAATRSQTGTDCYSAIVDRLKLRDPARRGSGMLTAVAAVGLIWSNPQSESALSIAANAIGTDTDTIATMAGAILGVNAESEPPVDVLDADLFRSEADRLTDIAVGRKPQDHRYPDLLRWSAPKTYADALVCLDRGGFHVRGLGHAELQGEPIQSQATGFMWQWLKLAGGQTLLIKRRKDIARISDEDSGLPVMQSSDRLPLSTRDLDQGMDVPNRDSAHSHASIASQTASEDQSRRSISQSELEAMIVYLDSRKYDDKVVGQVVRRVVNKCTVGQIGAFLSILIDCLREPSNPPPEQRR